MPGLLPYQQAQAQPNSYGPTLTSENSLTILSSIYKVLQILHFKSYTARLIKHKM